MTHEITPPPQSSCTQLETTGDATPAHTDVAASRLEKGYRAIALVVPEDGTGSSASTRPGVYRRSSASTKEGTNRNVYFSVVTRRPRLLVGHRARVRAMLARQGNCANEYEQNRGGNDDMGGGRGTGGRVGGLVQMPAPRQYLEKATKW